MKKLFTLFACAFLTFTLSAQAEQTAGSYYLGTGNALDLFNSLGDNGLNLEATIGYAVIDDLVVTGRINSNEYTVDNAEITLDLGVRYFMKGVFFQVGATNLLSADVMIGNDVSEGEMSVELGVGKFFNLGVLGDRLYVDPQINYNLNTGFETKIGLGLRF